MKTVAPQAVAAPATQDDMVQTMWLHGRQPTTVTTYRADAERFRAAVAKPLAAITLADLQDYAASLGDLSHATRARRLASIKSLFRFAYGLGALQLNPAAALRIEKPQITTSERIIAKGDVVRMIGAEPDPRRRAALGLLYQCGLRAAELCGLRWRDMTATGRKGGEARVLGKGAKLRTVTIAADLWRELEALTPAPRPDSPVIPGRSGEPLNYAALDRLVKRAAQRIGLPAEVSAHWLRHSIASHSLDGGAPVHVVQSQLGHASLATTTRYAHAKRGEALAHYLKA